MLVGLYIEITSIDRLQAGYTFTPCVGSFTSPGIDTRQKGPTAFSASSETHRHLLVFCLQADASLHLLGVCSTCRWRVCCIYSMCVLFEEGGPA